MGLAQGIAQFLDGRGPAPANFVCGGIAFPAISVYLCRMLKILALLILTSFVAPMVSAVPENEFSLNDVLKRLAHDDFKERTAAQQDLREWGEERVEEGIKVFYGLYRTHEEPEVRLRCRELLKELVVSHVLSKEGEGYMGIMMQDQAVIRPGQPVRNAVLITRVMPGTPAESAKLQAGDLITGIDELRFDQQLARDAFGAYVRGKKPEETVTLHMLREGAPMKQKVVLMKRPPDLDRPFFQFGDEFVPQDQETLEENEFRDWLKKKVDEGKVVPEKAPDAPRN